ncbi:hypothetical protein C1646_670206 [Rhizophagus diaphanus]|nr:hypothetical protein C1646_670206 [Rhizophagus diaphanus] [Rhizophagus sp. MUCL 43196]
MSNVHTLNDIKDREGGSYKKPGHWLDSAYEQELEKKLKSVTEFNSEINDFSEKLVDKYNEREKEYQRSYSDIGNKISQLNAFSAKENSCLREIISKKDIEIANHSNPPPPPMNDSSQKLPGKKYGIHGKKVILSILLTGTIFYHLQAFLRSEYMIGGWKFKDRN